MGRDGYRHPDGSHLILTLPGLLGVTGIYCAQPAADVLTLLVCILLVRSMKRIASRNMAALPDWQA